MSKASISRRRFATLAGATGAGALATGFPFARAKTMAARTQSAAQADRSSVEGPFTLASHNEVESRQQAANTFFEQNYPNVDPRYDITPGLDNYFVKLQAQIAGGSPPDVMLMHETRARAYAAQNLILPLDEFQAANPMPRPPEDFVGEGNYVYGGQRYYWPAGWGHYGIVYNKDLFDRAGVPYPTDDWTWREFVDIAKRFGSLPDTWGFTGWDNLGNLNYWYPLLKAYGGETFDEEDTQCLLNTPEGVETFDLIRELWCSNAMPEPATVEQLGGSGGYALFLEGRSAMHYFLVGDFAGLHPNRNGDFNYGLIAVPAGPRGRFIRLGGSSYGISQGAAQPQVAWELIRYLLSDEWAATLYPQLSAVPEYYERSSAPPPESLAMIPNWKQVAVDQGLQYATFVRYSKIGTQFSPMVSAETAALADCSRSAADVVASITEKAEQMFEDFG